jgi:glycosyltransferase involved in cell wall biosynthesis
VVSSHSPQCGFDVRRAIPFMSEAKNPLVSIVLLCFNHEKFVVEAIDGVLRQAYLPLDIVIVDDNSSDKTAQIIADKLAEHPDRCDVRFIRNATNMQWRAALEVGLQAARGAFIVISCGDDVMLPEMVAEMTDMWRNNKVSLVTVNADYIDEQSNSLGRSYRDCNVAADDSFETLARDGANACCFGAAMGFEREVYETFGLPPSHLGAFDIMLPYYAYLLRGARFLRKPLLKYRVHDRNSSLSLIAEKSHASEHELRVKERIFTGHLAHSILMQEELDRLSATMPERFAELSATIAPLLNIQTVEMAKKLVRTQIELHSLTR